MGLGSRAVSLGRAPVKTHSCGEPRGHKLTDPPGFSPALQNTKHTLSRSLGSSSFQPPLAGAGAESPGHPRMVRAMPTPNLSPSLLRRGRGVPGCHGIPPARHWARRHAPPQRKAPLIHLRVEETISQALFSWIPPPAADIQTRARETESERGRAGAGAKRPHPLSAWVSATFVINALSRGHIQMQRAPGQPEEQIRARSLLRHIPTAPAPRPRAGRAELRRAVGCSLPCAFLLPVFLWVF